MCLKKERVCIIYDRSAFLWLTDRHLPSKSCVRHSPLFACCGGVCWRGGSEVDWGHCFIISLARLLLRTMRQTTVKRSFNRHKLTSEHTSDVARAAQQMQQPSDRSSADGWKDNESRDTKANKLIKLFEKSESCIKILNECSRGVQCSAGTIIEVPPCV